MSQDLKSKLTAFSNIPESRLASIPMQPAGKEMEDEMLGNTAEVGPQMPTVEANPQPGPQMPPSGPGMQENAFNPAMTAPGSKLNVGDYLTGETVAGLLDSLMPVLIVMGMDAVMKVKLRNSDFQLTAKEQGVLAPLIDDCLKMYSVHVDSPVSALLIAMGMIYGSKVIAIMPEAMQRKVIRAEQKKQDEADGIERVPGSNRPAGIGGRGPYKKKPKA